MSGVNDSPEDALDSDDDQYAAELEDALDESENQSESFSAYETEGSNPEGSMEQKIVSSVNVCTHPGSMGGMCIVCGQNLEGEESGVTFGYIQKGLRLDDEEISRLSRKNMKSLLSRRKLCLVLDLDHTLLNTTALDRLTPQEMLLKTQTNTLQGSLFLLGHMNLMTKLRPFVHTFLKEASEMFEMYIYTMGDRPYALQMARLLDPQDEYFKDKVISRDDGTQKGKKNLDIVLGTENAILILDDREEVWPKHKDNLMLMERYLFFDSSCKDFDVRSDSLTTLQTDENETNGPLSKILRALKHIHCTFFDKLQGDLIDRDVRQVLSSLRGEVLSGCVIVFSSNFRAQIKKLRKTAERLGATWLREPNHTVTHVIATKFETKEYRWAVQNNRFLVSRQWFDESNLFLQKQPEENFSVRQMQHQQQQPQPPQH